MNYPLLTIFLLAHNNEGSIKKTLSSLVAMNVLIRGGYPRKILRRRLTPSLFIAFFENIDIRKIKACLVRTALNIGITLKLSKPLGKLLYKLRYSD